MCVWGVLLLPAPWALAGWPRPHVPADWEPALVPTQLRQVGVPAASLSAVTKGQLRSKDPHPWGRKHRPSNSHITQHEGGPPSEKPGLNAVGREPRAHVLTGTQRTGKAGEEEASCRGGLAPVWVSS